MRVRQLTYESIGALDGAGLGWKCLVERNTLAYSAGSSNASQESFINRPPVKDRMSCGWNLGGADPGTKLYILRNSPIGPIS